MTGPTVTDAKLEPCPFCGSANSARMLPPTCTPETPYDAADRLYPIVRCGNCFTEVCGANEDYTGKTAIARWNTRTATNRASEGDAWNALENIASHDAAANGLTGFAFELVEQLTGIARAALAAKPDPEATRTELVEARCSCADVSNKGNNHGE